MRESAGMISKAAAPENGLNRKKKKSRTEVKGPIKWTAIKGPVAAV